MLKALPFDISSLHRAYADSLSPVSLVRECMRRIDALGDPGIFLHLLSEDELAAQIATLGEFDPDAKPLWGIPCAIKDNIDMAGAPTTAACPAFSYIADEDAEVVRLLRQAGALIIGKTNLDQFAAGLVGVRSPYPVPKNALDPEIVPGGSSSGSAVSVAQGLVSFSLGTDTAGSGRVPAALNSIVGLKPTLGMLSARGVVPACRTLDTVSIFALSVEDAYRAFTSLNAYDAADAYSRELQAKPLAAPPNRIKLGIPSADTIRFFGDEVHKASFNATVKQLEAMGAEISEIDFNPFYDIANLLYEGSWVAERYASIEKMMKEQPEAVFPATYKVISKAESKSAVDCFNDMYRLQELKRLAQSRIDGVDMLCVPSIPTFYTVSDLAADPIQPNSNLGTYTNFVNLMDLCGISVPTAPREDGRPGSITLLARAAEDHLTAALANQVQQFYSPALGATGWSLPHSQVAATAPSKSTDAIELAVVGAHLSGMPLNHQLTDLNAKFLFKGYTAASYRLYRLAGGPPLRPGLVRSASGEAIEIEVWSLPIEAFGAFIAQVPSPLTIGSVELEDGQRVKGFLCEEIATLDAEEITRFNGWRGYMSEQPSL